jgi:5'-nucleotidase / UDP-sugar diphosphatase
MKRCRIALISLFLFMGLAPWAHAGQIDLRILYINDFHGFAEPVKAAGSQTPLGGIAYLAGAVDRARQGHTSILLSAGDMIQGHAWANLFKGQSVIDVMNAMRFDAMVVGNHEFNFGPEVLKERIAQANFPILGANVEGFPPLKPYVVKEVTGLKIGIIGVVTPDTVHTNPRNVAGLKFTDPESAIRKYLPELNARPISLSSCRTAAIRRIGTWPPGSRGLTLSSAGTPTRKFSNPNWWAKPSSSRPGNTARPWGCWISR